jgi:hypothetical protein
MTFVPIKIKPDFRARGYQPELGWYCYNTQTLRADLSKRFTFKKDCQKECDNRNSYKKENKNE